MTSFPRIAAGLAILSAAIVPALPAGAAVDASDPQRFVQSLTQEGFSVIRSGNRATGKARFRTLLTDNVAVDQISDRLIRRWLPTITPAQKAAYKAALPGYVIGTYADRLYEYSDANIQVIRVQPTTGGNADVYTLVTRPGAQPVRATWSLTQVNGQWKVLNLVVAGINVALAQAADFDAVIQRQGFDALIARMKARS